MSDNNIIYTVVGIACALFAWIFLLLLYYFLRKKANETSGTSSQLRKVTREDDSKEEGREISEEEEYFDSAAIAYGNPIPSKKRRGGEERKDGVVEGIRSDDYDFEKRATSERQVLDVSFSVFPPSIQRDVRTSSSHGRLPHQSSSLNGKSREQNENPMTVSRRSLPKDFAPSEWKKNPMSISSTLTLPPSSSLTSSFSWMPPLTSPSTSSFSLTFPDTQQQQQQQQRTKDAVLVCPSSPARGGGARPR